MSKKLLAAVFAAAFLATGGMAMGADDIKWNGTSWTSTQGGAWSAITSATADTTTTAVVGTQITAPTWTNGGLSIIGDSATGPASISGALNITSSAMIIGAATTGVIDLTAGNFVLTDGTLTVFAGSSLKTTGNGTVGSASTIASSKVFTVDGSYENAGLLESLGTIDNDGEFINSATLDIQGGTLDNGGTSALLNTGLIKVTGTATYTAGGAGIDNSASSTTTDGTKGISVLLTNNAAASGTASKIATDLVLGGTDGNIKNIGYVELTGDGVNNTAIAFTGATAGLVNLKDANLSTGTESVDAGGADLSVTGAWTTVTNTNTLAGKNVVLNATGGGTYGNVTATAVSGEGGVIDVQTASTFVGAVAGAFDLSANATLADGSSFVGGDINFTNDVKLINQDKTGGTGSVDLTGSAITGTGTIDNGNDAAVLTMGSGTTLEDTVKIINASTNFDGTLIVDGATFATVADNFDAAALTADGFGIVNVSSTLDAGTPGIDWATAADGELNVTGDVAGTINLGAGELTLVGGGRTIDTGSIITALSTTFGAGDTNKGTVNGSVNTGGALANEGTINLDGDAAADSTLTFNATGDKITNTGTIITGDKTVLTAPGLIDNSGGLLEMTGGMVQGEMTKLTTAVVGGNANVGIIDVSGNLKNGATNNNFILTGATDGVVTFESTQDNAGNINTFGADVILEGASNKMSGTIEGNSVTFAGNAGTYSGNITATGNTVDDGILIDGADNIFSGNTINTTGLAGTTLKNGQSVTFSDTTLNTVYNAGKGTTTKVADGDLILGATGVMNITDDAAIEFGLLDSTNPNLGMAQIAGNAAPGSTINLEGTTKLTVASGLGDVDDADLFDQDALDSLFVDGSQDPAAIEEYLNSQNTFSLGKQGTFTLGDDGIYYNQVISKNAGDNLDAVLAAQGISQYRGMISDTTLYTQWVMDQDFEDENTAAYQALSNPLDRYIVDVVRYANGQTVNGQTLMDGRWADEAYAIEQWKNGADWAGALEAVTDTARQFNRAITNRAYNLGSLMDSIEYDECGNVINSCGGFKNRIWAGYTGQWGKLDDRGWDKGYKYDAHGFNVGYDHVTSSGVGFGAAFGYSKGDYKNYGQLYGDKSKIDNYSFGLFASYNHRSGFFTTISGTYTYSKYKMHNGFSWLNNGSNMVAYDNAKYHGRTWSVGGEFGYDIKPMANLTITPTLGLYYYASHTNRFNSTYRNDMKYSNHSLEMPIDVNVKYDIAVGCESTLSLMANAGYAYNFNNKGTKIRGFTMGSDGLGAYEFGNGRMTKPGHSSWNVGAGAQFRYKNVDFGVNYEYYGRKDYTSHSVNANVGYSF